jgi:hypothetical protein
MVRVGRGGGARGGGLGVASLATRHPPRRACRHRRRKPAAAGHPTFRYSSREPASLEPVAMATRVTRSPGWPGCRLHGALAAGRLTPPPSTRYRSPELLADAVHEVGVQGAGRLQWP